MNPLLDAFGPELRAAAVNVLDRYGEVCVAHRFTHLTGLRIWHLLRRITELDAVLGNAQRDRPASDAFEVYRVPLFGIRGLGSDSAIRTAVRELLEREKEIVLGVRDGPTALDTDETDQPAEAEEWLAGHADEVLVGRHPFLLPESDVVIAYAPMADGTLKSGVY